MQTRALSTTSAITLLRSMPVVKTFRKRRYDRHFAVARNVHIFRGVFDSFEAAEASAPAGKPLSYNNDSSATMYLDDLQVVASDYPAMFWMHRSFVEGMRTVFDVGGNIGMKFLAYRQMMPVPAEVSWLVEDMPAVIAQGRRVAAARGIGSELRFTERFGAGSGFDVLLASGSLQYLPQTLGELLASLKDLPRRLIVNTTPLHEKRSFFTLNNIGTAFCPYRVQSKKAFVDSLLQAGYQQRDQWNHPGKGMSIPFTEGFDVEAYSGYCFDRVR